MSDPQTLKKTTFELHPEVHRALKMLAIQRDKNMSELAEEALREYLEKADLVE